MFYCEECRVKNKWPESFGKSRGQCELCKQSALCHDRPSSSLPKTVSPAEGTPVSTAEAREPSTFEQVIQKITSSHHEIIRLGYTGPEVALIKSKNEFNDAIAELRQMAKEVVSTVSGAHPITAQPLESSPDDEIFSAVIAACSAEKLTLDSSRHEADEAYNSGVEHCVDAINGVRARRSAHVKTGPGK